jgi:hypothetical protein
MTGFQKMKTFVPYANASLVYSKIRSVAQTDGANIPGWMVSFRAQQIENRETTLS